MAKLFKEHFSLKPNIGDTISAQVGDFRVVSRIVADDFTPPPWRYEDGHGVVRDWLSARDVGPGDRILRNDCGHCSIYMYRATIEAWAVDGRSTPAIERRRARGEEVGCHEAAKAAVEADYRRLKAWVNGSWRWAALETRIFLGDEVIAEDEVFGIAIGTGGQHRDNIRDDAEKSVARSLRYASDRACEMITVDVSRAARIAAAAEAFSSAATGVPN